MPKIENDLIDTVVAGELEADMEQAGKEGGDVLNARRAVRRKAILAVRQTLDALADYLGDSPLRGLPNLGTGSNPLKGVCVRSNYHDRRIALPKKGVSQGRKSVLLDHNKKVIWARYRGADLEMWPLTDDEILPEDAMGIAYAVGTAVKLHLDKCERDMVRYAEMTAFADRLLRLYEESG